MPAVAPRSPSVPTTGKPIKFAGIGEKLDQIEVFHPDRMASRILGMGDMLSLIEKAEANFDEEQAAKLQEKLKKNRFTLADYYDQLKQLRKMGSLSDIMGMLPGMKGKVNEEDIDESILTRTEAIIQSMTPAERDESLSPECQPPQKRIAAGSGTTVQQVNQVLKQFDMMQNLTRASLRRQDAQGPEGHDGRRNARHGQLRRRMAWAAATPRDAPSPIRSARKNVETRQKRFSNTMSTICWR